MANWTNRIQNAHVAQNENAQTAREFVNWATLMLANMSNQSFEMNRKAIKEIDAIRAQIIVGTLNKPAAMHNFKVELGIQD
jgi:hypothetical protein